MIAECGDIVFRAAVRKQSCAGVPCGPCAGGGPKRLRVLLEGESLLNDASGLTLFEVFFHIVSAETASASYACLPVASILFIS